MGGLARAHLTGSQSSVAAALIANLYRWPEANERLSSRYLETSTGLPRRTVRRALAALVQLGVIAVGPTRPGSHAGLIAFLPPESWAPASAQVGAPTRPLSGRTQVPTSPDTRGPLVGAPRCPEVGAPVRHKVIERELQEWYGEPAVYAAPRGDSPGTWQRDPAERRRLEALAAQAGAHRSSLSPEELAREELRMLEALPASEFRAVRILKVRRRLQEQQPTQ